MSNKDVEEKAIRCVLNYLKNQGINAKRVNNCGYDIQTDNKRIEVKSRKNRARILQLNYANINAFNKHEDIELWAVVDVKSDHPELMIISKKTLIERKKELKVWKFGLKNLEFDTSIRL
jgi:hypothetical protein